MNRTVLAVTAAVVALILPLVLPPFYVTLFTNIMISGLAVIGLVLLTGVAGLTSFGQAAFMGVGAYTTAYLTTTYGWNPWLTLPAGLMLTAIVAWVTGTATLRMQGHYLPLATIAWALSLYYIFGNTPALGGFTGLTGIPPVSLLGLELTDPRHFAYLTLFFLGSAIVTAQLLLSSRLGRALRALRSGRVVAEAFGADVYRLRLQVFLLASLLASVAGWLYAHQQRFVNPTPFGLNIGVELLFMAVLGGAGYVWGGVAGAAIVILLLELLQSVLPAVLGDAGNYETVVLGVVIILALQLAPGGLWSVLDSVIPERFRPLNRPLAQLPAHELPPAGSELYRVERAVKQFGGLRAINDVSLEIRSGEIVGLIGPNGAGKSTLFNLMTGVSSATGGKVFWKRQDVTQLPARAIHRGGVARTFQHVKLFPELTVLHNTMMGGYARGRASMLASMLHLERGEEAALEHSALKALQRVGLADLAQVKAGSLALGQQRLLEVARALVSRGVFILLDEPAAGLRSNEKIELAALLRSLRDEGFTILIVEHDMDLVMGLVDRLIVLSSGELLANGTPEEIQRHPQVREAYLGAEV